MFLIQRWEFDSLENNSEKAMYLVDVGYKTTEGEAREYCEQQGYLKGDECWALSVQLRMGLMKAPVPKYQYKEIKAL